MDEVASSDPKVPRKQKPDIVCRNSSEGIAPMKPPSRVGVSWHHSVNSQRRSLKTEPNDSGTAIKDASCCFETVNEQENASSDIAVHIPSEVLSIWEQEDVIMMNGKKEAKADKAAVARQQQERAAYRRSLATQGIYEGFNKDSPVSTRQHQDQTAVHNDDKQPMLKEGTNTTPASLDLQKDLDAKNCARAENMSPSQYQEETVVINAALGMGSHTLVPHTPEENGDQLAMTDGPAILSSLESNEIQIQVNEQVQAIPQVVSGHLLPQPGAVAVRGYDLEASGREDTLRYDFGSAAEANTTSRARSEHFLINAFLVDRNDEEGTVQATALPYEIPWRKRLCIGCLVVLAIGMVLGLVIPVISSSSPTTASTSVSPPEGAASAAVQINTTVVIQLDENPEETGWSLACDTGTILSVPPGTYERPNRKVSVRVQVGIGEECTFKIFDTGENGIEGGFYALIYDNGDSLVEESASFTDFDEVTFTVSAPRNPQTRRHQQKGLDF